MSLQTKFPFSVKLLTERLAKEEHDLAIWQNVVENKTNCWTDKAIRQAKGNIPSTQNRIKDLKEGIDLLNPSS